jgi:hypothetical protein
MCKGENINNSQHGSDSTTRTPLASSNNGNGTIGNGSGNGRNGRATGERPHSAVILPSAISAPFVEIDGGEQQQQIMDEGNQNTRTKTPRRLEKVKSISLI